MSRPNQPTTKDKKPLDDVAAALFPAEVVDVPIGNGMVLQAEIYPFSFEHMQRFSGELVHISALVERVLLTQVPRDTDPQKAMEYVIGAALPKVLSSLLPVVSECVMFIGEKFSALNIMSPRFPAYAAGAIVRKWIDMNFSDIEKWRPWMDARKKAMEIYASTQPRTSETPSPSSHPADSE